MLEEIQDNYTYSLSNKKWLQREKNDEEVINYVSQFGISSIIAGILINKDISPSEVENFISPTLKEYLPNPFEIKDMEKGARRIIEAIKNNEKIAIYGDYDVDGATSSSLFKRYFRMLGIDVDIHIPDRILEGYGPNINALRALQKKGINLVITVDCGTTSLAVLNEIKKEGLDVIIVDHHLSGDVLPDVYALINPSRKDVISEYTYLAAVGVSFLVLVAVNNILRMEYYFENQSIEEPNLLSLLDIVALGTICDVVPLIGVNRAFVNQGLKILSKWSKPGFAALAENAKIDLYPNTYHLGFLLGPRINAGGRVGKSDLGVRLLSTDNEEEAKLIAQDLEMFNEERKAIEFSVLEQSITKLESSNKNRNVIIIANNNWHQGVIGIAASRIKEKYNKPTIVISIENGVGKGSCRSVRGFNIGESIAIAKNKGILLEGGGHAMAAGLSVLEEKIPELEIFLEEIYNKCQDQINEYDIRYYESKVTTDYINLDIAKQIASIGPFGAGNEEPLFYITNIKILKIDVFSEQHIRLFITNKELHTGDSKIAIAFRSVNDDIGQFLLNSKGKNFGLIGYIRINYWKGTEKPNFIITDVVEEL